MSSRKRTFEETNDSKSSCPYPPPKKQKTLNDYFSKSMFQNSTDHNEFVFYFNTMEKIKLTKELNVPSIINREIAEYAIGTLKQCSNALCKSGICILNSELQDFNQQKTSKWKYCPRKNKYFCENCAFHTIYFDCCDTIQCVLESKKCDHLQLDKDKTKTMCYDDFNNEYLTGYKCLYCNFDNGGICTDCNEWSCGYHQLKCDNFQHNWCCSVIGVCSGCNSRFCSKCDDYGGMTLFCGSCYMNMSSSQCEECYEIFCENCMDKFIENDNNIFCEKCDDWYCDKCVQKKNIGKQCVECKNMACNKTDCVVFGNCIECNSDICVMCNGEICYKCSKGYCLLCIAKGGKGKVCETRTWCKEFTCNDCNESMFKGCCSSCTVWYWKYLKIDGLVLLIKEWKEENPEINRKLIENKLMENYEELSHEFLQSDEKLNEAMARVIV